MRHAITILCLFASAANAITPTLGSNCGVGATIVGSKEAGKVTLGTGVDACTLTFSWPGGKVPSCAANDETATRPVDATTTATTVTFGIGIYTPDGNVISYLCVGQ